MRAALVLLLSLATLSACTNSSSAPWQGEEKLKAADGQTWVVGSHLVTVPPQTAQPPLGSTVRLSGQRTQRGELLIDSVEVLDTPAAQVTPAARVQPTPKPAPRVQPTTPPRAPAPTPMKKPHRDNTNYDGDDDD